MVFRCGLVVTTGIEHHQIRRMDRICPTPARNGFGPRDAGLASFAIGIRFGHRVERSRELFLESAGASATVVATAGFYEEAKLFRKTRPVLRVCIRHKDDQSSRLPV